MAIIKLNTRSLSDDSVTTPKIADTVNLGRRNIIINGAMQVAQRGTSFTGLGNGDNGYKLDRFKFAESGSPNGEFTLTQATDAPNGFGNSMKFDCTTAETSLDANEMIRIIQGIEGQNLQSFKKGTSDAESMTVSFYVKSNLTGDAVVALYDQDNTRYNAKTYTINSADTWERKTLTFQPDTTGSFGNDNNSSMELWFFLQAGSQFKSGSAPSNWETYTEGNLAVGQDINIASSTDNEFLITGIQLEVGDTATPFEHRSYGEELALCQRYFAKLGADPNSTGNPSYQAYAAGCNQSNNTSQNIALVYPQTMRVTPTLAYSGNIGITANGSYVNVSTFAATYGGTKSALLQTNTPAVGSAGQGIVLLGNADTTAYITLTAEM